MHWDKDRMLWQRTEQPGQMKTRVPDEREFASEGDQSLRWCWSCRQVRVPTYSVYENTVSTAAVSENNSRPFSCFVVAVVVNGNDRK